MILDAQQLFSDSQAVAGPATVVSTNVIDLSQDRDIGIGHAMLIAAFVKVAAAGGGTLNMQLFTDDNVGFASATLVAETGLIAAAALTAGQKLVLPIPPDKKTERFLRVSYVLAVMTGITVTTELMPADFLQNEGVFPDAITIG